MEIEWNTKFIDPSNLISISRGDSAKMERYLRQFMELIPTRVADLKMHLKDGNRKLIRQTLHQMSPQLQFFGIPNVVMPIKRLELEYETMPFNDLETLINEILRKLDGAFEEVNGVIKVYFSP